MEQSSPFAQRLKSISARRKLQELILSTRLDLEQEKLRAQRLKRKSLREQWLMEGTSASPGDRDPLTPLREAEKRIEELQQSLTSLHGQMQQLDHLEIWKVPQEPPSEEPTRDAEVMNRSPADLEKVDGTAASSSESRNGARSASESSPASPRTPVHAEAKVNLQNGEMHDGDLFGNECSPEEAKVKAIPVVSEKGEPAPHQGGSEAAASPAGQSVAPSKGPASRQRKLAMEEIVIRDHLGQEVGCMDAVGQNQGSLKKEEELEDPTNLGESCDQRSQPGQVSNPKEALGEGPLDHELGRRDDPEGQSPTFPDHQDHSGLLPNENSDPKGQGEGLLEMGSQAKDVGLKDVKQKAVPDQGVQEMEPALALATGEAPTTGSVEQSQGSQMKTQELATREKGLAEFSHLSQVHAQTTSLAERVISPPPEVEPFVLERSPSSGHEMEKTVTHQGQELSRHEGEGSLPESIPSLTDRTVPLQEAEISPLEETPAPLQEPMPMAPEGQIPHLPEVYVCLPSQVPLSVGDPCESPIVLPDRAPPALQDTESTSPVSKNPVSSLQEADGAPPGEIQAPLPSHTSPNLPEDVGSAPDQVPPTSEDQTTISPLGQAPSFQEAAPSLPEGQNSSDPPEGKLNVAEPTPPPDKAQTPGLSDASICPHALPLSSREPLQPLLDTTEALEMLDADGSGDASVASAGAATEVLESLRAEQQPLLQEDQGPGAPLDISVGEPQPKAGILKPPGATIQQAPNNNSHPSANTAYSPQLQAAPPRQGQDQEPERGKHKSCQCCTLM